MTSSSRRQRTQSNIDTSSIDLPDEIIESILSRCPGKSVVRFKSVSKSWLSIISNPRFSRIHHIQQSKLPENQNMKTYESRNCPLYMISYMILEDEKIRKEHVMYDPTYGFSPLSSCDGLILLKNYNDRDEEEYMLWNPLIQKHIIIPAFTRETHPEAFRNRPHNYAFYFWLHHLYFDSIADDYKILRSYKNWYTVYSCKNGIWGEIKDIPVDLLPVIFATTCVDGCIYNNRKGEIVCFDARDGKLHKFPQPNDIEGLVKDMSGRLCLYELSEDFRRLQLWVMENNGSFDKSWRKLICMEKEEPHLWDLYPLCLTNEDDVVLSARWVSDSDSVSEDGDEFIYKYNPRENCFQVIDVDNSNHYFPYFENLYMPSSKIF